MANSSPCIAITPGAENGIGPELLAYVLGQHRNSTKSFYWCGDYASLLLAANRARLPVERMGQNQALLNERTKLFFLRDFVETSLEKRQAWFLQEAIRLAKDKMANGIVTGPINKAALAHLDDAKLAGQTEYLAKHLGAINEQSFMGFVGGPFLMSLLTTHIPLKDIASRLSQPFIIEHLWAVANHGARYLKKDLGQLKIVILGLNPHAGENGLIGDEEQKIILPAVQMAKKEGLAVLGPIAADGFFAYLDRWPKDNFPDIVVAIYHDQGLIPYKLLAQGGAVNVTFGLTIPRVSPAHGTASDLVGKGLACAKSTKMALKVAIELAQRN